MDPIKIIRKYYGPESKAYYLLTRHSEMVAEKSVRIAQRVRHLHPDPDFIREAAMLHDIGIFLTNEPGIGCHGDREYICHGYLGREILEKEGLPRHALVCERHVGVGLSAAEIEDKNLPVPEGICCLYPLRNRLSVLPINFSRRTPNSCCRKNRWTG